MPCFAPSSRTPRIFTIPPIGRWCGGVASVVLIGCVSGGFLAGCSGTPRTATPLPAATVEVGGTRVEVSRVYFSQGRNAVIPLVPPEEVPPAQRAAWVPAGPPVIVLENGLTLSSRVYRVGASAWSDPVAPRRWLPPVVPWRSTPLEGYTADNDPSGVWVAVVEAPRGLPERRLPTFCRVNDRVIDVTWLPPVPQNPDLASAAVPQVSASTLLELGELLRPEAGDPQRRWRVRLLAARLGVGALWASPPPGLGEVPSGLSEPLEAAAEQLELNVRAAIDAVRKADPAVALALVNRLTAIVRTPDGVLLPAWPITGEDAASLMSKLLDPRVALADKPDIARAWLDASPGATAWIIDDIGVPSTEAGTLRLEPTVGLADLAGSGGQARLTSTSGFAGEELEAAVSPAHAVALRAPMPIVRDGARPVIEAALSGMAVQLRPIAGRARVSPPGFSLGPVLHPWTLGTWRERNPSPVTGPGAAAVLIQRKVGGGWEAYVRAQPEPDGSPGEVVLWFGAFGNATATIRVTEGSAEIRDRGTGEPRPVGAAFSKDGMVWTTLIPISDSLIDDGTLLVGLQRLAPVGGQVTTSAAFPRPMLPGQAEPGRVALDLTGW